MRKLVIGFLAAPTLGIAFDVDPPVGILPSS